MTERTEQAYAARTLGDLDTLGSDLPPLQPPGRRPGAGHVPARPGAPVPAAGGQAGRGPRGPAPLGALWYGLLSLVLLVVWAMSGRDYFWPIWPMLGFALLLGWQAFSVLGPRPEDQGRRDRDR